MRWVRRVYERQQTINSRPLKICRLHLAYTYKSNIIRFFKLQLESVPKVDLLQMWLPQARTNFRCNSASSSNQLSLHSAKQTTSGKERDSSTADVKTLKEGGERRLLHSRLEPLTGASLHHTQIQSPICPVCPCRTKRREQEGLSNPRRRRRGRDI